MAEIDGTRRQALMEVFLPEYNRLHGTAFEWNPEVQAYLEETFLDASADILCQDSQSRAVLKIQHTRAEGDPNDERIRPANCAPIANRLKTLLQQQGVSGLAVYLNFSDPPSRQEHQDKLAGLLATFVSEKSGDEPALFQLDYPVDIKGAYARIWNHVSNLVVRKVPDYPGVFLGWGWATGRGSAAVPDDARIETALAKKAAKLAGSGGDLVLLIDFETFPFSDAVYLPAIQERLEGRTAPFREVWVISCHPGTSNCWRIAASSAT